MIDDPNEVMRELLSRLRSSTANVPDIDEAMKRIENADIAGLLADAMSHLRRATDLLNEGRADEEPDESERSGPARAEEHAE